MYSSQVARTLLARMQQESASRLGMADQNSGKFPNIETHIEHIRTCGRHLQPVKLWGRCSSVQPFGCQRRDMLCLEDSNKHFEAGM